ncbi:MAG: BMP family ABC transporter substrate-binding protein [Candidatus Limnocylindria bacterium]
MRIQRRHGFVATLITSALVLAACSSAQIDVGKGLCRVIGDNAAATPAPVTAGGTSDLLVGVVTDVGTLDDRNFNQYSWEGAKAGAASIGAPEPKAVVTTNESQYAANIQSFIDQNYDIIITVGFALGAATLEAATANPDVHFIGVDQFQGNDPVGNYESLIYSEAQAGYLAGIIAGSISVSGEIATLGGANFIPPVVNYMRGFQNGVLSVNADATVHLKYVTDSDLTLAFNDPAGGKSFADQFLAQNTGVDVLFQVAGKTGNGMLQAVEEAGIYGIGVDVDQWASTADSAECIVTSAEKKLTSSVRTAIEEFAAGTVRDSNQFLGADTDMIGLAPYYQFADLITSEIQGKVDTAFEAMAGGTLDPCAPNACFTGDPDPGT